MAGSPASCNPASLAPSALKPGDRVCLAGTPEWGVGVVQSCIGNRVTVGFEEVGKQTIDLRHANLIAAPDHPPRT